MTRFEQIDPVIRQWSHERQLPLYTEYKETEVRSFEVPGSSGAACQIWIEVGHTLSVCVWDRADRRRTFETDASSLRGALDEALNVARRWAS